MSHTDKQVIGKIGENCAVTYLERHGYKVIDRNYRKKYGEIDIIATKQGILHFVEVKSITKTNEVEPRWLDEEDPDDYEAEENVHPWKLKRLRRVIEAYLLAKYPDDDDEEPDWQLDVITVSVDREARIGQVKILEDIDLC